MKIKSFKQGFSLVELLVVITIIAILSVVAYTAVGGQTVNAKNSKRLQDLNTIQQALELHFVKNNEYPAQLSDMGKDVISKIPQDPNKTDQYFYSRDGSNSKKYVLATTLEDPESDTLTGNLVGNDDAFSFNWPTDAATQCTVDENTVNFDGCYPYEPNN